MKKYIPVPEHLHRGRKLSTKDAEWLKAEYKKYKNVTYGTFHTKTEWYKFMAEKFDVHPRTIMYHVEKNINRMQKDAARKVRLDTETQVRLRKERLKRVKEQVDYYGDVNNPTGPRRKLYKEQDT